MARPLRIEFPDAFYHITCRGIARRRIFIDDSGHLLPAGVYFIQLTDGSFSVIRKVIKIGG